MDFFVRLSNLFVGKTAGSTNWKSDVKMSVSIRTSLGDIKIELHCDLVPTSCENFLALCGTGRYDNTTFHRVIPDFVAQAGDRGGSSIWGRKFKDEFHPSLRHDSRGVVSWATSSPDSNANQFFILLAKKAPHLDNVSTVFGRVIDGFEVLDLIEKTPTDSKDHPLTPITIISTTIHANPLAT